MHHRSAQLSDYRSMHFHLHNFHRSSSRTSSRCTPSNCHRPRRPPRHGCLSDWEIHLGRCLLSSVDARACRIHHVKSYVSVRDYRINVHVDCVTFITESCSSSSHHISRRSCSRSRFKLFISDWPMSNDRGEREVGRRIKISFSRIDRSLKCHKRCFLRSIQFEPLSTSAFMLIVLNLNSSFSYIIPRDDFASSLKEIDKNRERMLCSLKTGPWSTFSTEEKATMKFAFNRVRSLRASSLFIFLMIIFTKMKMKMINADFFSFLTREAAEQRTCVSKVESWDYIV